MCKQAVVDSIKPSETTEPQITRKPSERYFTQLENKTNINASSSRGEIKVSEPEKLSNYVSVHAYIQVIPKDAKWTEFSE